MAPAIAPNYAALDRLLSAVELAPSPAEAQAILCGLFAANAPEPIRCWREQLLVPPLDREGGDAPLADMSEASMAARDITFEGRATVVEHDCGHDHDHNHHCSDAQGADESAEDEHAETERDQALTGIANWTQAAITPPSVSFDLLLPPEEQPLLERATAVHDWIRGAVYGLALGGLERDGLDAEAREAFDDLVELTRLDLASIEEGEEDERALMEVVEFLRVALMSIRESGLSSQRASEPWSGQAEPEQ
jgi:uncharacterized protein YgfB (UPF0149 family)